MLYKHFTDSKTNTNVICTPKVFNFWGAYQNALDGILNSWDRRI